MAKSKSAKKHGLSDKVRTKKASGPQKINPFEVKVNTQKHNVLGKKPASYDRGKPGASRSRAIKKRKETLLVEYKQRGKVNKFVDRRFGETDPEISLEDKMLQRFALERQKTHDKSSTFNLNEEDELTHFGQSLSQIEKFDDPDISDDEDDHGKLDGDLVGEEHFGGFLTRKKTDGEDPTKSWKERMEEIIARSKKHKHERQSEREKTDEITEKLNQDWKTLMGSLVSAKRNKETDGPTPKADDYDITVRQLYYESKAKATDRLKTEEELAKEEQEKLEKLEADRMRRMKGITEQEDEISKVVYRSADDLDDQFSLGKKRGKVNFAAPEDSDEESEDDEDSDEEEDSGDDEEDGEDEEEGSDEEDAGESSEDDPLAHTSDLESEDSDGEETKPAAKGVITSKVPDTLTAEQKLDKIKEKASVMAAARRELPYTFPAPETYPALLDLLKDHPGPDQLVIIDRLQKLYHPSLAEGNKDKLQTLHSLLAQYVCDLALQDPPQLAVASLITPTVYSLTQRWPEAAGTLWAGLVQDRWAEYRGETRARYPGLDVLVLFKLVAALFPTSDFRHPVVTPTALFMGQILAQSSVSSPLDVASGLFVCALFLQYTTLSKRYVPEVINFLTGLLFTASTKLPDKIERLPPPPFKPVGRHVDLLKLDKPCTKCKLEPLSVTKTFSTAGMEYMETDSYKVCVLHQTLSLLSKFADLYKDLPSTTEIFTPARHFCTKINFKHYPKDVRKTHSDLITKLDSLKEMAKTPLVRPKDRPKPLQTFEPKFDDVFDGRKKRVGSKDKQEQDRLVHKYKKEMKGAVRTLRQDNMFLAREKLKDTMERDADRKRKVKELFADLASQEGDFQKLKRLKEKA